MAFTAADVKKLREMTNVGMMDCKKALTETDGDMDKAVEWLREKGLAKAAKEGRAALLPRAWLTPLSAKSAASALLSRSTARPTSARSPIRSSSSSRISARSSCKDNPADVDALMECKYPGTELTGLPRSMPEKVMSIGENLQIRRFARFDKNTSVSYVHAGGKIGVLVNLEVEGGIDATDQSARTLRCRSQR